MSSKPPSGLANGSGAAGSETDSIEDSLNQILAEADAPPAAPGQNGPAEMSADDGLSEEDIPTPLGGLPDEAAEVAAAIPPPAEAVAVDATPVARTVEELASMSGPALV